MSPSPRISAAFCRGGLESVDAIDRALGQRVRAAMEPSILHDIETASRLAWLPIEHDAELTRALFFVAGPTRALRVLRDSMVRALDAPMLKPLRMAAMGVFGATLKSTLGWVPRVWSVIYRDAGEVIVEDAGPAGVDFVLRGLPPTIIANPNYVLGFAAVFEAAFVVYGVDGRMVLCDPDPLSGDIRIKARW